MAASSSSSYSYDRYDVFLSFRGTDTRKNFVSHLFAKLKEQGFNVFHDTMLERGESVSSGLLRAIEGSKLSTIVFSKNYAESRWCLDELVKIVDCHHRSPHPQIVLPVFYDVQPSDVRKQDDQYAAAFVNHEKNRHVQQVEEWKAALNEVGNLSGLHLENDSNGDHADFIRKIVKQVAARLYQPYLNVADHPVGIESHVIQLNGLLNSKTDDIHIVAICGIGGIGKTTIAKALFNEHCNLFDGSCFLADVRATAARPDDVGMVTLQERLMAAIIKENMPKIQSCHQGIEVIKQRLWCRRVLIVLDDIDNVGQLKKLAINRRWLRQGSIIIITTRDRSCVSSLDAKFYEPEPLGPNNSLELFSWHAFGNDFPNAYYNAVSHEVVEYAGGVPLVLETLGSYMRDIETIEEWRQALVRLRIIPHDDVQAKLKLSFDSLGPKEKKLFLDIACFFVGTTKKEFMLQVLDEKAPEYYPKFEFKVLCKRCLVKIDDFGKLSMHDMVRDMGREIVRRESFDDPGRRSRLCHPHDVLSVLKDYSGTEAIESIFLEVSNSYEEPVEMKAFANMTNLRMVHFSNIKVHGTYNNMKLFENLKFLRWYSFPLACLPSNLNIRNLVALHLQNSRLEQLWLGTKSMDKLIFLNVSDSHFLTSTPDFSGVINLEKLLLRNCTNLGEIHHSIGCLHKLIVLDLTNCKSLTKVPLNLFQLKSLKDANLSGCSKLFEPTQFEASLFGLWNWFSSRLSWKPQPKSLEPTFLLRNYLQGQNCLTKLDLSDCNLSCLPTEIGNLASLVELRLGGNKFSSLPTSIKYLQCLRVLDVRDCVKLKSIQGLPSGIMYLLAQICPLLETIEVASGSSGEIALDVSRNTELVDNLFPNKVHVLSKFNMYVNGYEDYMGEIPYWFSYQGVGLFISFVVPQHTNRRVKGWIVAASIDSNFIIGIVYNKTKDMHSDFVYTIISKGVWMRYVELSKHGIVAGGGDEIEIVFMGEEESGKCGLCLVYDDEDVVGNYEQIIPIQYSPRLDSYVDFYSDDDDFYSDDDFIHSIYPIDLYVSLVMRARIKPMLDDLRHFDFDIVLMLLRKLVDEGEGGSSGEHPEIYHTIANALYNQLCPHGDPFFILRMLEH